jgi:hypothetical protein
LLLFIILTNWLFAFDFRVSELISIPGDNENVNVIQIQPFFHTRYMCWQNTYNSHYSIYLKRLYPAIGEDILIYSDSSYNINPQITDLNSWDDIRIVWQSKIDNQWFLLQRIYSADTLGEITRLIDFPIDSMDYSLSWHRIAFIKDGNLMLKSLFPGFEGYTETIQIDSGLCSNPDMIYEDYSFYHAIIYEKGAEGNKQIYKAENFYLSSNNGYEFEIINVPEESENNINPKFSSLAETITYQSYIDEFWNVIALGGGISYLSKNSNCNYLNPFFFYYDVTTNETGSYTPFFVVFDSDSIAENEEIYIETLSSHPNYTVNISNSDGIDEKPIVSVIEDSLVIIWEHRENNKTDIWWAKDKFIHYPFKIHDERKYNEPSEFRIIQNYPNPFNPTTKIVLEIFKSISDKATIKIYDIIGELVRTVIKDIDGIGNYSITWDGKSESGIILPAGIYYYSITFGTMTHSGKMTLIK